MQGSFSSEDDGGYGQLEYFIYPGFPKEGPSDLPMGSPSYFISMASRIFPWPVLSQLHTPFHKCTPSVCESLILTHTLVYLYICMNIIMYAYIHTYTHTRTFIHVHAQTHTHTHTHTRRHIHMHTYIHPYWQYLRVLTFCDPHSPLPSPLKHPGMASKWNAIYKSRKEPDLIFKDLFWWILLHQKSEQV